MTGGDILGVALGNLGRRKGRAALTAAGVVVGVATLVLMVSLGLGIRREVLQLFTTQDELRTVRVSRISAEKKDDASGPFGMLMMANQIIPLTEADLEEMRKLPGVERVKPILDMVLRVKSEGRVMPSRVSGALPDEHERFRKALVAGALWGDGEGFDCLLPTVYVEAVKARPEQLVGTTVIFTPLVADGETKDIECRVAGVFDSDALGFTGGFVYLPMDRALEVRDRMKGGISFLPYKKGTYPRAMVVVEDPRELDRVKGRLSNSGFMAVATSDIIEGFDVIFLIVEGIMICVGGIGLVVSLFGIANTMAMAVLERTREIGIMKAIGARNRDVGRLFLVEAGLVGLLGGAGGLVLAFAGKGILEWAVNLLQVRAGESLSLFYIPFWLAVTAMGFSMAVSMLAGLIPARRAARMDPVASLRYE